MHNHENYINNNRKNFLKLDKVIIDINYKELKILSKLVYNYIDNLYFTGNDYGGLSRYKLKEEIAIDNTLSNEEYVSLKKIALKLNLMKNGSNM
jgi:hypothetical protein